MYFRLELSEHTRAWLSVMWLFLSPARPGRFNSAGVLLIFSLFAQSCVCAIPRPTLQVDGAHLLRWRRRKERRRVFFLRNCWRLLWNIWSATLWLLRQQLFSSFFSTFLSHAVIWLAVGTKRWSKENAFCFADWSIKKTYTVSPPKPLKKEQREKLLKLWYFQAYVIILYEFL